jgi:predicted transcriptional regulator
MRFLKGIWREERIEWNCTNDPDAIIEKAVLLAKVVTRLRGKINVVVKEEYGGEKTYYSEPIIEEPERCIQALYALMRGHALIQGRTQIQTVDLPVIIDVALSSAPWDRINAFTYLLTKEKVTTKDLIDDLKCSRSKAIRVMKMLELLDLVDLQEEPYQTYGGEQTGYTMMLKQEFNWFKSAEFQRLWRLKEQASTEEKAQTLQTYQETIKV